MSQFTVIHVYDYREKRAFSDTSLPRHMIDQKALCAQVGKHPDNHQLIVVECEDPAEIEGQYCKKLALYFSDSRVYISPIDNIRNGF